MRNLYTQAFDSISASADFKQNLKNSINEYKINALSGTVKKGNKHFVWNIKRAIVAASTAVVLIFCAIFIPLMAINNDENPNNPLKPNNGLEWGFDGNFNGNGEPSYKFYSAFKTEKRRYTLNEDIKIMLYYGSIYSNYETVDYEGNPISLWQDWEQPLEDDELTGHKTVLYYSNHASNYYNPNHSIFDCDYCHLYKIKDEDYFAEEYRIRKSCDINSFYYRFPFIEEITLPKELFTGIQGRVYFGFQTVGIFEDGSIPNDGAALFGQGGAILYRFQGEELLISDSDRQLWNIGLSATFTETFKTPNGSTSNGVGGSPFVANFSWNGIEYDRIDLVKFAANITPRKLNIDGGYKYSLQVQKMSTVSDYDFNKVIVYAMSLDGSEKKNIGSYRNFFSIELEANRIYVFIAKYDKGTIESIFITSN